MLNAPRSMGKTKNMDSGGTKTNSAGCGESTARVSAGPRRAEVLADRQLVDECLSGEQSAWERLYRRCHPALILAVRKHLGPRADDQELVDEIAAQVWFLVIQNDGQVLNRFSTKRDCRLASYLGGLARNQVRNHTRGEQRRQAREVEATRRHWSGATTHAARNPLETQDFLSTLTDREREYVAWCLLPPGEEDAAGEPFSVTESNDRQIRHRLRNKMRNFFGRK